MATERDVHPAVAGAQPYMLAHRQGPNSRNRPLFESGEGRERLEKVLSRYPTKRAALLPMLNFAQEMNGWISTEAMEEIADALELTPAYVRSVATFYTMYNRKPVGTYLVQVCTNISCDLCRGEEVLERFLEETETRLGETSRDRLFTVMEVECLGACGFATAVQINDAYYENVTPERVPEIVRELRAAAPDAREGREVASGAGDGQGDAVAGRSEGTGSAGGEAG